MAKKYEITWRRFSPIVTLSRTKIKKVIMFVVSKFISAAKTDLW